MLLESVPNVSEGRRPEVVRRLGAAAAVEGVHLLDLSSDADHHRSVLTLAGDGPDLERGLLALYEAALEAIDLSRHRGVHPRVGAVDVVPFVPLGGAGMSAAVDSAHRLGARVAERFGLGVYLYGEAADRPERRNLAEIRRGGVPGLERRLAGGGWEPDFGPPRVDSRAGVTVIGARFFLIAFNALLDTGDLETARGIARKIRESSGGLAAVKSIGVYLESVDRAQVSMNLVDYRVTSPAAALQAVRAEAAARGARVVSTEIVGLVPEAAFADSSPAELQIEGFTEDLVLEHRLRACGLLP